ncbi:MAG TPA: STAS domain-containing protein [Tepidisphaeraceae bacterium]|nr:STAS domain-containing protein [Tepidisphaeraceae bacterium]
MDRDCGVASPRSIYPMPPVADYETNDLLVRQVEGVTIVRVRYPNLDGLLEIQRITAELDALLARGVRKLVFDFKYVTHAGSAALGLLIALQRKIDARGGTLVLSHAERVEELLTVSRTASLFKRAPDPRAAFKMF